MLFLILPTWSCLSLSYFVALFRCRTLSKFIFRVYLFSGILWKWFLRCCKNVLRCFSNTLRSIASLRWSVLESFLSARSRLFSPGRTKGIEPKSGSSESHNNTSSAFENGRQNDTEKTVAEGQRSCFCRMQKRNAFLSNSRNTFSKYSQFFVVRRKRLCDSFENLFQDFIPGFIFDIATSKSTGIAFWHKKRGFLAILFPNRSRLLFVFLLFFVSFVVDSSLSVCWGNWLYMYKVYKQYIRVYIQKLLSESSRNEVCSE